MNAPARLAMLGVFLACAPFAALRAQDAKVLVERLADANERAAARSQLLAMGADAVPALAAAFADAGDKQLTAVLAILTELGPAAGAAVPQLVARARDERKPTTQIVEIVATIAELAPWCEGLATADRRKVTTALFTGSRKDATGPLPAEATAANERLHLRSSFARDTATEELIAIVDGARRPFSRELAIELLGRRGREAQAALPALARVLATPEPRVLLIERTVPLHAKAARAMLAIAPDSDTAALARDVLAGKAPASRADKPALPERTRVRIDELVRDLEAPEKRAAAVANLVAFGALAAEPVAAALASASADTQRAAIAVLRGLGPDAVAALPQVVTALRVLPAADLLDAFDVVVAAMLRSADALPLSISAGPTSVCVGDHLVTGLEPETVARFMRSWREYEAASTVDGNGTLREFGVWLARADPFVRERALIVAAQRGEGARPLLARIGEMMTSSHPPARVDPGGIEVLDRTREVQRAAARAVLAIAPPGDPLIAEARKVLGEPAPK